MTTALAIYGALAATAAIGWQVFTWMRQTRTRVRVKPLRIFLDFGPGKWAGPALAVKVYNDSHHPIRVERVGLWAHDGSGRRLRVVYAGQGEIPGVIQPRDSGMAYIVRGPVEQEGDLSKPIVAFAELADDSRHDSEPTVVDDHVSEAHAE